MISDHVFTIIREKGLCGACFRTLRFERELNIIIIRGRVALWEFPTAVSLDETRHPVAIVCGECASLGLDPALCVEFGPGFFIRYYRIEILPEAPGRTLSTPVKPEDGDAQD